MDLKLPVHPNIYSNPFPKFGKPKVIGFIGLENLKFAQCVRDMKVKFDLNHNIDQAKRKPSDLDVKLTELLRFLLENQVRLKYKGADTLEAAPFYCYRGLMTCVACSPYVKRDPWKIVVVLYKGCIYLCARDTKEKIKQKLNMTEEEKKCCSWGFKFEQYMLSDHPNAEPNSTEPVDEMAEFSLVFKTHLNKHTIVYGAEMDGIRCDKSSALPIPSPEAGPDEKVEYLSTKEFVELKTNRHIEFSRQEMNFRRFKMKKWWCQSFLVGINTILCGFRNEFGIVEELKVYKVNDLPKVAKNFWEPNICFNFLDSFLTFVKKCLQREIIRQHGERALKNLTKLPLIALQLEWYPGSQVKISNNYSYEDDEILPDWFINAYGKNVDLDLELGNLQ